ncbi:hypothetical protein [Nocardia asiatica]|uniref:hypothetical protein n=1 Tax=Nocardia asiatica TaxID=209252 RepID=UPI003EDFB449
MAVGCALVLGTGLRDLDWTALGRDIVLYTAGTVLVAVLAAGQIRRTPRDAPGNPLSAFAVAEGGLGVGRGEFTSLLIALGAVWIVVKRQVRAQVPLPRCTRSRSVACAKYWRANKLDSARSPALPTRWRSINALCLRSDGRLVLPEPAQPPTSVPDRADRVARWARDPTGKFTVDCSARRH